MKICANCQRKYSDSLEYCLADGTVLAPMDDPQATLRFEARPTHASAPSKHGVQVLPFVLAAMVLVGIAGAAAFVLYLGRTNKAAVDPGRSNDPSASTTNAGTGPDDRSGSAMEQEIRKLQQIHSALAVSMVQSDVAAIDRLLADDYRYTNDLGWSFNKQQTLTAYRTGQVRYDSVTAPDPIVEMNKDLTRAVVSGRAYTIGRLGKTRFNNSYLYQNIYEKRQDRWQLVRAEARYR